MEIPTVLLLGGLASGFVLSIAALARALVGAGIGDLRLRLWQIHDEVVDGLVADSYTRPEQAQQVLTTVRSIIFHAKEFTFLRVFGGFALIHAFAEPDLFKSASKQSIFEGRPVDDLLKEQIQRLSRVLAMSVFRTSLIGRLGVLLLPIVWVVWRVSHRKGIQHVPEPQRMASRPIRTEVKREIVLNGVTHPQDRELASAAC